MSMLGKVRIGHKAPDFHCEAVIKGVIEDVTLSTYIHPPTKPGVTNPDAPWLIILFIPAAFSFVCPTEVLAFQNCLDEFKDRRSSVVFISVDTKHSLWHWQNVPRQFGGLGMIDIPLLSDATHRISRDYGVLIEDEGVSLRGMFIIDGAGIVQQITLNNLTVGRSVLEALRLLEAFQAVAKHGVLCPIDWKPSDNAQDTLNTIANTLTESYEERLANLQKEFEGVPVTDLDAKHRSQEDSKETSVDGESRDSETAMDLTPGPSVDVDSTSNPPPSAIQEISCHRPKHTSQAHSPRNDCLPYPSLPSPLSNTKSFDTNRTLSASASQSAQNTPRPTPESPKISGPQMTARHARGHHSTAPASPLRLVRSLTSSTIVPILRQPPNHNSNTYESRRGSHVVLEFAEPTSSPPALASTRQKPPATLSRASSWAGVVRSAPASSPSSIGWLSLESAATTPGVPAQTRLQMTFEAIKKISTGLGSPRVDGSPGRGDHLEGGRSLGYFDGVGGEGGV